MINRHVKNCVALATSIPMYILSLPFYALQLIFPHIPLCTAGSSAGAGSEVFHVYRHLRRRENARQDYIQKTAQKEDLELEFQEKLARNHILAEERTSKKRAKRYSYKRTRKRNRVLKEIAAHVHMHSKVKIVWSAITHMWTLFSYSFNLEFPINFMLPNQHLGWLDFMFTLSHQ